jgi:hypothetical protein
VSACFVLPSPLRDLFAVAFAAGITTQLISLTEMRRRLFPFGTVRRRLISHTIQQRIEEVDK